MVVWLAVSASACRSERPRPNRLILGTRTEPRTLDPAFARRAGAQEIVRLLFRGLTNFDDQWRLRADLAAELPLAATSTTGGWTVQWRLRPGLHWSDGRPLTSHDVIFGHRIEADDRWAAVNHHDAQLVEHMFAVDAERVRVQWRRPFVGYRAPRVHAVLPRHAYPVRSTASREQFPASFSGITDAPVSSGPFVLERWERGRQLVLTRNPHWSGARPALDQVIFRFLQSEDALEAELLAGTIDAIGEAGGLSPDRAARLARRLEPSHEVVFAESSVRLGVECRADHALVGRTDVRQALSAIIDRTAFGEVAYAGAARPARGLFPPRHPAHRAETLDIAMSPAEARALLAGLQDPPSVPLAFAAESDAARRAAVYLQNVWTQAGFPVALDSKPFSVLLEQLSERKQAPLVLLALRMRPDWDGHSVLQADGAQNYGGHVDAQIIAWIDEARSTPDPIRWQAALEKVERRFRRDLPSIPLVFRRTASVRPRALLGWRPTGTTTPVTWNAEAWRWRRRE